MRLTDSQYKDLLSRAEAIGPEGVAKFAKMVAQDYTADSIMRALLDMVAPITGKPGAPTKLSQLDDDTFLRGLTGTADNI